MVRVCHILSGDLWAGAEVMARNLLEGLSKTRDVELAVILLNEGKLADEIRRIGIPLAVFPENEFSFPSLCRKTREHLKRLAPDILHSHRYKENLLAWLASGNGRGKRLVSTQHGMAESAGKGFGVKSRLVMSFNFTLLRRRFHRVVAVSRDIRNAFVRNLGFPEDMVCVVHNGISAPRPLAPPPGERGGFVVGSSGRLTGVKDYPLMVAIAGEVAREAPDVRFELAGEGPEESEIARRIRDLDLEGVFRIRGFVEDVESFYAGLDLYLNTSRHEGIPMTLLEAMSLGIPVVAPDVGGIGEIVEDGVSGFLVRGRDPAAFAERCIRLRRDAAMRSRFSVAARERVRNHFSTGRMAEEYMNVYLAAKGSRFPI